MVLPRAQQPVGAASYLKDKVLAMATTQESPEPGGMTDRVHDVPPAAPAGSGKPRRASLVLLQSREQQAGLQEQSQATDQMLAELEALLASSSAISAGAGDRSTLSTQENVAVDLDNPDCDRPTPSALRTVRHA